MFTFWASPEPRRSWWASSSPRPRAASPRWPTSRSPSCTSSPPLHSLEKNWQAVESAACEARLTRSSWTVSYARRRRSQAPPDSPVTAGKDTDFLSALLFFSLVVVTFGQVFSSRKPNKEFVNWPPFDQAVITTTMHQMLSITSFWSWKYVLKLFVSQFAKNLRTMLCFKSFCEFLS